MALIENIQRQELDPIEIAITYGRLMKECQLTHKQLAERLGKGRTTITNFTRLLTLPENIQKGVQHGIIAMGHAKALLGTDDIAFQLGAYNEIVNKHLSVRQTENLIALHKQGHNSQNLRPKKKLPSAYQKVQNELATALSTKVNLKTDSKGKGQIIINFLDTEDLNRILDILDAEK